MCILRLQTATDLHSVLPSVPISSFTPVMLGLLMHIFMPQSIVVILSNVNLFILREKGVAMDVQSRICKG